MIRAGLHLSKGPSKISNIKSIGTLTITKCISTPQAVIPY